MNRGEVYYLKDDNSWGHEVASGRPVLILSSRGEIDRAPTVVVASLTTAPRDYVPSAVKINSTNRDSWVLCNAIRHVDKARISSYMCTLTDEEMVEVENAVARVIDLPTKEASSCVDIELKVEVEMYQRLYQKAMSELVEVSHKYNVLKFATKQGLNSHYGYKVTDIEEIPFVPKEEPKLDVDTEALKTKMMGGEVAEPVDREEKIPQKLRKVYGGNKSDRGLTPDEIDTLLIQAGMQPTSNKPQNASTFGKACLRPGAKPINVNTATKEDFISLGMGDGVSTNIIRHRKKHGKFASFDELLTVKGVGKGVFTVFAPMWRL